MPLRRRAGLLEWTTREDIVAQLSRRNVLIGALGVICGVWLLGLYPPVDEATVEGVLIMEFATAVPLTMAVRSRRRLARALRQIDSGAPQHVETLANDAHEADERSWRLSLLIDQLDERADGDVKRRSRQAAESAASTHRSLLNRRHHVLQMREVVRRSSARADLEQSLSDVDAQLRSLDDATDQLAAAVARMLSDASSGPVHDDLAAIESASQRLTSMAAAWRELDALDPPAATS